MCTWCQTLWYLRWILLYLFWFKANYYSFYFIFMEYISLSISLKIEIVSRSSNDLFTVFCIYLSAFEFFIADMNGIFVGSQDAFVGWAVITIGAFEGFFVGVFPSNVNPQCSFGKGTKITFITLEGFVFVMFTFDMHFHAVSTRCWELT